MTKEFNIGDIYSYNKVPTFKVQVIEKNGASKVVDATGSSGWSVGQIFNKVDSHSFTLFKEEVNSNEILSLLDKLEEKITHEDIISKDF